MHAAALFPLLLSELAIGIAALLGFLSIERETARFFKFHSLVAAACWVLVSILVAGQARYPYLGFGIVCLCAWAQFRGGRLFKGKMWLSLAAGLGLAFGVTGLARGYPGSLPAGCPVGLGFWFFSRIYAGVPLIAVAYMAFAFAFASPGETIDAPGRLRTALKMIPWFVLGRGLWSLAILGIAAGKAPEWTRAFLASGFGTAAGASFLFVRVGAGLALPAFLAVSLLRNMPAKDPRTERTSVLLLCVAVVMGELLALMLGF
ncbi:MAG: hypothetical protein WC378_14025 [Opitutaceae bacterium]|jgi:hypothetical protein